MSMARETLKMEEKEELKEVSGLLQGLPKTQRERFMWMVRGAALVTDAKEESK